MINSLNSPIRVILLLPVLLAGLAPMLAKAAEPAINAALRAKLQAPAAYASASPTNAALARGYAERGFSPMWQTQDRRQQLLAEIEALVDDGLNPSHYQIDRLRQTLPDTASAAQRAEDDITVSEACTQALTDLQRGRFDPMQIGHYWRPSSMPAPTYPPATDQLAKAGDDLSALFNRFRPQTPLYRSLRAAMVEARQAGAGTKWPLVPDGDTLKAGVSSPRVIDLRARLLASGQLDAGAGSNDQMDDVLVEAVRSFQREEGLEADGMVGPATLAALNRSNAERRALLRINLERARWIAPYQQGEHVLVDVAGYSLTYFKGAEAKWSARTQVGMPARETPELFSRITHFTLNPTWTVPPTILRKDIIPKAITDPEYLASRNIRVLNRDGEEVDPATVDWNNTSGLTLRQDAGDGAALGKIVVRFANPYAIYLHDTPNQRQFKRSQRAFSSGCVRVEDAVDLARLLIDASGGETHLARFESALASGRTGNLSLPRAVPLVIAYLTAAPDDTGRVIYRPDVYGRDQDLIRAFSSAGK